MSIFSSTGIFQKSSDITSVIESATDEYRRMELLEDGVMKYTPSMVPVHSRNTTQGEKYLVEFDMLEKVSRYMDISISEAFESVCAENGIIDDDAFVVMEDPDEELEEKCCASCSATLENSIDIDNSICNKYIDINELKESGINILVTSEMINESRVNPELKSKWKDYKRGGNNSLSEQFNKLKRMFDDCESLSDYKFMKRRLAMFNNMKELADKTIQNKVIDLIKRCDKKIEEIKDENDQKKFDAKQYRRDQIMARREEKRQARAAKRAAKATSSD